MSDPTDTELADALVERGIVKAQPMCWQLLDAAGDIYAVFTDTRLLVEDARVAMACMKRLDTGFNTIRYNDGRWTARTIKNSNWHGLHESLERAICTAFVEAIGCDHNWKISDVLIESSALPDIEIWKCSKCDETKRVEATK